MSEARRGPEPPDLSEKGGMKDGQPQRSNARLFMQFLAFGGCADAATLADALARAKISGDRELTDLGNRAVDEHPSRVWVDQPDERHPDGERGPSRLRASLASHGRTFPVSIIAA